MQVDTAAYERSHGQPPRGRARWSFQFDNGPGDYRPDVFSFVGPYSKVARRAREMARRYKYKRVQVLP